MSSHWTTSSPRSGWRTQAEEGTLTRGCLRRLGRGAGGFFLGGGVRVTGGAGFESGAGFQSVAAPQRLQERRTPSLVAQTSASTLVSSIFSRALQELQTSERRPSSISAGVTGGKSMSQKRRSGSKKATP